MSSAPRLEISRDDFHRGRTRRIRRYDGAAAQTPSSQKSWHSTLELSGRNFTCFRVTKELPVTEL